MDHGCEFHGIASVEPWKNAECDQNESGNYVMTQLNTLIGDETSATNCLSFGAEPLEWS